MVRRLLTVLCALALSAAAAHSALPSAGRTAAGEAIRAAAAHRDIEALKAQLVQLAAEQSAGEKSAGDRQARLDLLNAQESELSARMGRNRNSLARLLGALELYRRNPPPALLVNPGSATDAVNAAILARAMAPELGRRARAFEVKAAALRDVRRQVASASTDLFQSESALAERKARIEAMIQQKMALEGGLGSDGQANTGDGLAAMGQGEDAAALAEDRAADQAAGLGDHPPERLLEPVQGPVVARYGDSGDRSRAKGWTWRAGPGAQVRAPAAGVVEYAGPLKGWGVVLILRVGGGYHLVLAGLGSVQASVGRAVATGEPVGFMAAGGESKRADLYVEVRKMGAPVDPAPWFSVSARAARNAG